MTHNEANNEYDMLKGCINRMFITDSFEELNTLCSSAIIYLSDIYKHNYSRLQKEEFAKYRSEP